MGSFKRNGRDQGASRRRVEKGHRRRGALNIESLEARLLLDAGSNGWKPTTANLGDVQNGPMANEGHNLIGIYQAFTGNGGDAAAAAAQYPYVQFQGDLVGVDVKGSGDFNAFLASLRDLGMKVTDASATYAVVEGFLPITQLPTVARLPQTVAASPIYRPRTSFVGVANNEAEKSLNADVARQQTGLDGTGVTVGVLSDTVNQVPGGLAASVKTGDLPAGVKVIADGPAAGATDEGRAMLENIHDIAPGAGLSFATATTGELSFGDHIRSLASAGAKVIVDDIGYADEPMFQDGFIAQGVNDATNQFGASFLSASGNNANDNGYLSDFRGTSATVGSLGAGRFMNFAPSGAAVTQLPVEVKAETVLAFQFDQPYFTQEPAGSSNDVTSNINLIVLDSTGKVVTSGADNTTATHAPYQSVDIKTPGSYTIAIQVISGPDPGHVEFLRVSNGPDNAFLVSQQFGAAGNTSYPSTYGHSAAVNTIGVGAVPFFASTPYLGQTPLKSEPFSSPGPAVFVRNSDGSPRGAGVVVQNPAVSGPDGGNTSFFGTVNDTTKPFDTGQPVTPTNVSQPNLPSFFGTSSSAPNVAAVAALLKQRSPSLSSAQVRAGLEAGARPLNGAAPNTYDPQGGYGLVDAVRALASVDVLRVATTNPPNGVSLTTPPTQIVVTFSRPIDFSTVSAADLVFSGLPPGVTGVTVGTPVAIGDPRFPTQVAFPFTFSVAPGQNGNGTFAYVLRGSIVSKDGKVLQNFAGAFAIADVLAPRVINTKVTGRIVTVQFSEPVAPSSVNRNTLFVALTDRNGAILGVLNNDPRFKISYDPNTATATLDYTALDQTELPSGFYKLVVRGGNPNGFGGSEPGVTNLVGNRLDGEFNGVFPSGDGDPTSPSNPSGRSGDENFVQPIGFQTIAAPVITSLNLVTPSDTGIIGDENTNINRPTFVGQVSANFPGSVAGLTILAEFNSLHGGNLDLTSQNGRGFVGSFDVRTTTDANGQFFLGAPFLFEGFTRVRLVVQGQPDSPPLPGLSSTFDHAFRIDNTAPAILAASLFPGGPLLPLGVANAEATLTNLSLDVVDKSNPQSGQLATPAPVLFPALDPTSASNISNYSLTNLTTNTDESSFIATAKFTPTTDDYVSGPNRTSPDQPYFGRVDLTFSQGLPAGIYKLTAHTHESVYGGLSDAAGTPLNDLGVAGEGTRDFVIRFNIQPQPTYITSVTTDVSNAQGNTLLPKSYYEINPRQGDIVSAPPTTFNVDFSNPLDPTKDYTNAIQLIGTADTPGGTPDGDFGTLGVAGLGSTGTGSSRFNPAGTTVTLTRNANGTPNTRLVLQLPGGTVLPADHYRLYIPNTGALTINDIYNNQLDGEFVGNQAISGIDPNGNPAFEDLLPTGQYRPGMSGDGVAGGAFTAGFVVVPTGNLIYARPDYVEDPLLPSTTPDGSLAKPYSVLAPQAGPNALNQSTLNNGDPNGGLNSSVNFLSGFNPVFDRAGIGRFARSALYAARQLSSLGPVVVVALPGAPQRDPGTGLVSQRTFVLQAPTGSNSIINDGSASVPFDTVLVFNPGSTLKLQNASLFAQNQGSAIQAVGGANPNDRVTFTSYADNSVAGNTNGQGADSTPRGGDWGGIVFRNFNDAVNNRNDTFPVDGFLQGPGTQRAVSGADDSLSDISFTNIKYAGGAVPATRGTRYDAVTLFNSRPTITQDNISLSGGPASSQGGISGDLDSFREDDTARGPLIRRDVLSQNSLNGIYVRANLNGVIQQTDAEIYPDNPMSLGGARNYTFDAPLPYLFIARMEIGTELLSDTPNQATSSVLSRLYLQPGTMIKFQRGAGIEVKTPGASLNVGDRTYINGFDSQAFVDPTTGLPSSTYGPTDPNFRPNTTGDARVVFTSLFDNTATTSFFDPITQQTTTIVPAIDSANTGPVNVLQPTPNNVPDLARWGSVTIYSGAIADIDEADIRYGGGTLNVAGGTDTRNVLTLNGGFGRQTTQLVNGQFVTTRTPGNGSRVMVTNNNFFDNTDTPIHADPDSLLATDPTRPLSSGHPFFHGNVLERNGLNGLSVGQIGGLAPLLEQYNLSNDSSWDQTDITYILRGTIIPEPDRTFNFGQFGGPPPAPGAEAKPFVVLTIHSALPDTLLADGQRIARPGASVVVKEQGAGPGDGVAGSTSADNGGAGFLFGVDDGLDPPTDSFIDQGNNDQLRILGIGGNETTGQQRVPVVITSIHDNTVGPTVRGVDLTHVITGDAVQPTAGDGGLIYFGGNSLTTYNAFDIREGNRIDNADIRYITRIEMQGGGNVDLPPGVAQGANAGIDSIKAGVFPNLPNGQPDPRNASIQRNASKELTLSNDNFSNFRDVGVLTHPGFDLITNGLRDGGIRGEPTQLFLYNSTISNTPTGVRVIGEQGSDTNVPNVEEFVALNNTFYNDALGVDIIAQVFNGTNFRAHVHFVPMDNIFSNSATAAIQSVGQTQGSVAEYNLFFQNGADNNSSVPNDQPIFGDPMFRDAPRGNFQLLEGSAAIDAARSELNLNPTSQGAIVTTLIPIADQVLDATGGIRNSNSRSPDSNNFSLSNIPNNLLTLPGYPLRGYVDQFVPVLPTDPTGIAGPATTASSFLYAPIDGERDALGFLRVKDPNSPHVGFGSRPFFDIGAFEYRQLFPPHVTGVTATVTDPTSPNGVRTLPLYAVGGVAGTNQNIQTIQVQFDNRIDPNTLNERTVLLEASGGDAIFGNNNSTGDKFFNLAGKLSFDPNTHILTINVGAAGLNLGNDKYRLFLLGSGSDVIRDPQGNALSGTNTLNDDPNNPQLPLPSGNGFPGGNFFDTFIINNQAPSIVPFSFGLDPASDTNRPNDQVTKDTLPSFIGVISVAQPRIDPLAGQTVILDISTRGDGNFDRLNAGTATTDAAGRFLVTVGQDGAQTGLVTDTSPLPNSPYNVGPDGLLRTRDDFGYTWARIRVIDQSGNTTDLPTDQLQSFINNGAQTGLVIDTTPPHITSLTPGPNTRLQPDASGRLTFIFTTDKNIDPASLNGNSILVTRAGPDGLLGTKDDVNVPVITSSIVFRPYGVGPKGPEQFSFQVGGNLPNDLYAVTLKGSGTTPIIDIAGNALAGAFNGTFPSGGGNTPGTDFNPVFVLFSLGNVNTKFVGASATYLTDPRAPQGTRANPFPTINSALTAAGIGDVIGVLPGVYTEQITLKPFIRIISTDPTSTDTNFLVGNAQQTVIRAPQTFGIVPGTGKNGPQLTPSGLYYTIQASNLPIVPGVDSEVSGFTIASPLFGNPALGFIDPESVAVDITDSGVLFAHDYIVDSHIGVHIVVVGANAATPRVLDSGVIGNDIGILVEDKGATSLSTLAPILNNTIALNTVGLQAVDNNNSFLLANIVNNIFWENHDQTAQRNGTGIASTVPNKLVVRSNLFSGNGPSDKNPADDAVNVGNGFLAAFLHSTPDALGNFTGNPAFVSPIDPRPGSDGPASFFLGANFGLTKSSAAIDAGDNSQATPIDFLYNPRVLIPGRGFPGTGPADVGAFEYRPTGGNAVGGGFRIAATSLSPIGAATTNGSSVFTPHTAPGSITMSFSQNVDPKSIAATDLVLYGDGVSPVGGAHATSFNWIDPHTVRFNLAGNYNPQGSVVVKVNEGSVQSVGHSPVMGYTDLFHIQPETTTQARSFTQLAPAPASPSTVHAASASIPISPAVSLTPAPAAAPANHHAAVHHAAHPRRTFFRASRKKR